MPHGLSEPAHVPCRPSYSEVSTLRNLVHDSSPAEGKRSLEDVLSVCKSRAAGVEALYDLHIVKLHALLHVH